MTLSSDNFKIYFSPTSIPTSIYSKTLWISSETNKDLKFLNDYLKPWDVFIDIGSNIGVLTLEWSSIVWEKWRVFSFEPNPHTFAFLEKNIILNNFNNIITLNLGLGENSKELLFWWWTSDDQFKVSNTNKWIKIDIKALDSIWQIKKIKNIDLLKIDVEWYEKEVLLWSIKVLKKTETIYFESREKLLTTNWTTTKEVLSILTESWFRVYKTYNNYIYEIPKFYISSECENLLAIKNINNFLKRTWYRKY